MSSFHHYLPGRFGAGVCLGSFLLCYCFRFHAQLDLTRDTHFLLFVIVNSAASFALDAHHCNNITGSRGKELHRAGHRKSLRSPIPISTFDFDHFLGCCLHAHGVQAGLGSQPSRNFLFLSSWDCYYDHGLRFGSSLLQDISSGRPHGQNVVYPTCVHGCHYYYYHHLSTLLAVVVTILASSAP
jgi:hypothetical protein